MSIASLYFRQFILVVQNRRRTEEIIAERKEGQLLERKKKYGVRNLKKGI